jgi:hypothetical protein
VSCGAGEVAASVAAGGDDSAFGSEAMDRAVCHAHCNAATAIPIDHQQIKDEVLNEESAVMSERLSEQGVEQGVASSVSDSCGSIRHPALPILQRLPTKRTLIYLTVRSPRERHPVRLKLQNCPRRVFGHMENRILVS